MLYKGVTQQKMMEELRPVQIKKLFSRFADYGKRVLKKLILQWISKHFLNKGCIVPVDVVAEV